MSDKLPSLTPAQKDLLRRYFKFYRELSAGHRMPENEAQAHFVAVCHGKAVPRTEHEEAYQAFRSLLSMKGLSEDQVVIGEIDGEEYQANEIGGEPAASPATTSPSNTVQSNKSSTVNAATPIGPECFACAGAGFIKPLGESVKRRCSECKGTGRARSPSPEDCERYGKELSAPPAGFIYQDNRYGNRRWHA